MSEGEVDRQLVERAQRGDKKAFELLVAKYQRKLGRLLSRFIRDAGEVEHTLHTIGFHPSICRETAEWAVRDPGREAGLPTAS